MTISHLTHHDRAPVAVASHHEIKGSAKKSDVPGIGSAGYHTENTTGARERGPEPRILLPMSGRARPRLRSETAGLKPSPIIP